MKNRGFRVLAATSAVAGLVVGVAPQSSRTARAPSLPRCTDAQLAPVLGATMVNQGVGSYSDQGYKLVRRKDTVVRFFLKNQSAVGSTCSGTTNVRSATLTVTSGSSPGGNYTTSSLQTFGTSGTTIPSSTVSVDSNADPKFVVPADFVNSCLVNLASAACDDSASGFTLTFTADIKYTTSNTTTQVSVSPAP